MILDLISRSVGRCAPMFLVTLMLGALLSGPSVATSQVVPESVLAKNVKEPIGVAASPGRLLVTHPFCGNPREVLSISGTGKVTVFATLPNRSPIEDNPGACFEDYLTIVPAPPNPESLKGFPTPWPNGFRSNDVFVTQGSKIIKIAFDGSSVTTFTTLANCLNTQSGITFDNVGSFGNKLIVVCANGKVYTVDSAGVASLQEETINATGPFEGPVVAPFTFTPFGGCLLVAADHAPAGVGQPNGRVFAFPSSCSDPTVVASVPLAEGVTIIPTTKCTFALTPGDTYFTAIFGVGGSTIDQLPQSAFAGLGGRALVPSESNSGGESPPGITLLTPGEGVSTSTFRPFFAQHQGSAFVDCHVPILVRIQVIQQDATLTLKIFGDSSFDPALIIVDSLRFGPNGNEVPANLNCTLPQKDDQESPTGAEHEHNGVATCTMVNNLAPGQRGIYKARFTDPANPGGDADSEGGG
jgi:hypothetical protein